MADLPIKLKVGYKTYTVRELSESESELSGNLGYVNNNKNVIGIYRSGTSDELNTLLHEILHACVSVGCLPLKREELVVSVLANQLVDVFISNPDLIHYIKAKILEDASDQTIF